MYKKIPPLKATDIARFWKYTKKGDGCWEWTGCRQNGYGVLLIDYENYKASRVSYYLHNGDCNTRLMACHTCDNPGCVNPQHIFLGTCKENMGDCVAKGRIAHNPMSNKVREGYKRWVRDNPLARSGGNNVNAKLTESNVRLIKKMMDERKRCVDIAREIGASWASVNFVMKGITWNHITGLPNARRKP